MRTATLVGGCLLAGLSARVIAAQDCETGGIWVTAEELAVLPMQGPAWESVLAAANEPAGPPNLGDINDGLDVTIMAKALVYARTGVDTYRHAVVVACMAAIGTETGGTALALARNLVAYVIAADLVGLPPADDEVFRAWLLEVRDKDLLGRTLRSTHADRPNNWGTHAGASRAAVALYLCDAEDFEQAATVFKGWLGDRDAYAGFVYSELWWQADPQMPVGINPVGSTIQGYSVDGVLPDDQRRSGPFAWPPPQENYVYTALQGSLAHAVILDRQGYDVWNWSDRALLRAVRRSERVPSMSLLSLLSTMLIAQVAAGGKFFCPTLRGQRLRPVPAQLGNCYSLRRRPSHQLHVLLVRHPKTRHRPSRLRHKEGSPSRSRYGSYSWASLR